MIEKIKHVSNPLTIIAIFAGLAEISGSGALGLLDAAGKHIFIWFLMLFPSVLVLCFFLVLYLKPTALYAPSDYKSDDNFLKAVEKNQVINDVFDSISSKMDEISKEIASFAGVKNEKIGEGNIDDLTKIIDERFEILKTAINSGKELVEKVSDNKFEPSGIGWDVVDIESGGKFYRVKNIQPQERSEDAFRRAVARRNAAIYGFPRDDKQLKEAIDKYLSGSSGMASGKKRDPKD